MTSFKLNIPQVKQNIVKYKEKKELVIEDLNLVYGALDYVDSGWNDKNTPVFKEILKKDKQKEFELLEYMDDIYKEINIFCANIDELCRAQVYTNGSYSLSFNDSNIQTCINYLNGAIYTLDNLLWYINSTSSDNQQYLNAVKNLRVAINSLKTNINDLIKQINNFVKLVNAEINNSKNRLKGLQNSNFSLKKMDYTWKLVDMEQTR